MRYCTLFRIYSIFGISVGGWAYHFPFRSFARDRTAVLPISTVILWLLFSSFFKSIHAWIRSEFDQPVLIEWCPAQIPWLIVVVWWKSVAMAMQCNHMDVFWGEQKIRRHSRAFLHLGIEVNLKKVPITLFSATNPSLFSCRTSRSIMLLRNNKTMTKMLGTLAHLWTVN